MPYWEKEENKILVKEYERGMTLENIQKLLSRHTVIGIERQKDRIGVLRKYEKIIANKRVGYLDIETDNLNADVGVMLSYYIKTRGKEEYFCDCITAKDLKAKDKFTIDKRIIQKLIDDMKKFDIIVTYYGTGFDIPFIRARALKHNLNFPEYGAYTHIDLYYIARSKLKITRKSLDNVCRLLGIKGKTHVDMSVWFNARYGDVKSLKYIMDHNKWDVVILESAHKKLEKFTAGLRRSI